MHATPVLRSVLSTPQGCNGYETNLRLTFRIGSARRPRYGLNRVVTAQPLELTHALLGLHLAQATEQRLQVHTRQLTIGLPFHGGGLGVVARGRHRSKKRFSEVTDWTP